MLLRSNKITSIKINNITEFNDFLFSIYDNKNTIKIYETLDFSRINLNQAQAEELIYLLSKENIEITTLDLSGNYIHTVPYISRLTCATLNLDGNKISCIPDNKYISEFIEEINLSNNIISDLQIISFWYINEAENTQYAAAIDLGLSEQEILEIVNNYKSTPDAAKIEIVKEFVDQQFDQKASVKFIKEELIRLRSLLKHSDRVTAIGIVELIKFYIKDKSSNGFAAMAEQYLAQPSSQPLKRTKRF